MNPDEGTTDPFPDASVVTSAPFRDARGEFARLYDAKWRSSLLGDMVVAQVNHSVTLGRGTVRGLHYQVGPYCETKLIACLRGSVFDVVVDVRRGSPNFLSWHSQVLSAEVGRILVVPPGFAHGFQALEDECELIYIHSQPYQPDSEEGLHPCDPRLAVRWPEPVGRMSERDAAHPHVMDNWGGIDL